MQKIKLRYIRKGECSRCGQCCIVEKCEHLAWSDNIARCKIYKNRFLRCRLFPEMPPIPFEDCSYYFLDTYEDNRVVKEKV